MYIHILYYNIHPYTVQGSSNCWNGGFLVLTPEMVPKVKLFAIWRRIKSHAAQDFMLHFWAVSGAHPLSYIQNHGIN